MLTKCKANCTDCCLCTCRKRCLWLWTFTNIWNVNPRQICQIILTPYALLVKSLEVNQRAVWLSYKYCYLLKSTGHLAHTFPRSWKAKYLFIQKCTCKSLHVVLLCVAIWRTTNLLSILKVWPAKGVPG